MRKRTIGVLMGALLPGMTLLGEAGHAEIGEHTIKFATAGAQGSPIALGMEKFGEIVEAKSDGKITVKTYPGGTLGGDVQTLSAVQGGTVEMTTMNAGIVASVAKDFAVVDLPFLFDSPKEADAVMDGPVGAALAAKLPPSGLVGLAYWELGFRQLTNSERPIATVDDIEGLKIRVIQSPIYIDLFNALGANAVPMPFTELYTALQTGAIDGQENPAPSILTAKLNEVQDYMTLTNHTYNPQLVMISGKFWDTLNEEERQLLQQATLEARDYQRTVSREQAAKAVDELKSEGMEVTELPPEEVSKFREKANAVADKYAAEIDPALMQQLTAQLAELRGKN